VGGELQMDETEKNSYRRFLARIELEKLREGCNGLRLVGNGLIVPHPEFTDSRQWEEAQDCEPVPIRVGPARISD